MLEDEGITLVARTKTVTLLTSRLCLLFFTRKGVQIFIGDSLLTPLEKAKYLFLAVAMGLLAAFILGREAMAVGVFTGHKMWFDSFQVNKVRLLARLPSLSERTIPMSSLKRVRIDRRKRDELGFYSLRLDTVKGSLRFYVEPSSLAGKEKRLENILGQLLDTD